MDPTNHLVKDLISYDESNNSYEYLKNNQISIPEDAESYLAYQKGVNNLIKLRDM